MGHPDGRDGLDRARLTELIVLMGEHAMVVKSVGVLSVGKVLGCLGAVLGLLYFGVILWQDLGRAPAAFPQTKGDALANGIIIFISAPIAFGVLGFIGGILLAALYNVVARGLGGIEITLGERERKEAAQNQRDATI